MFFDLDGVAGEISMADQLQRRIAERASKAPRFLGSLAQNALNRTPPLGFFRDFRARDEAGDTRTPSTQSQASSNRSAGVM